MSREPEMSHFRRVLAAIAVSSLGDGFVLVGFPLLALSTTRNPIAIAGVSVAGQLPAFLCALPAGALIDRLDRRRLATTVNLGRAAALAGLCAVEAIVGIELWAIYVTVAILGVLEVVFQALSQASLAVLLPRDALARANGQLATAEIGGEQLVGPALGGVLFSFMRAIPFVADAVSFVVAGGLIRGVLPDTQARPPSQGWRADITEGLRWFWNQPAFRLLTCLIGGIAFCQAMVLSVVALYAVRSLGLSEIGYGLLMAAVAVGSVAGALGASRIVGLLGASTAIFVAVLVVAASYIILSATHSPVTAGAGLALEAVGVAVCNVTVVSARQSLTPEHLLGRVTTAWRMIILGLVPFGALTGGISAAHLGLRPTFLLAGCAAASATIALGPSTWRHLSRLHPLEERAEAGEVVDLRQRLADQDPVTGAFQE